MCDEGQSLPGERFTALPLTMAPVHILSTVLCCRVVKHLRRRFKPPREETRGRQRQPDRVSQTGSSPSVRQHVPFAGLPQTLEVLPRFPARLWWRRGALLCWEVRAVVTCRGRLGYRWRGWGNGRLWGEEREVKYSKINRDAVM